MACKLLLLPAATIRMGSKAWLLLRATAATSRRMTDLNFNFKIGFFSKALSIQNRIRNYSIQSGGLQPPDLPRLAETARISLTPDESDSVDTEGENLRDDLPKIFENRDAMIAAVPCYDEPFIKVPKVLNKE
ncbi:Carbon--nitrogen ligases with glutamine as amido-N-donor [Sarracenia purpurea var. burkii]